MEWFIRGEGKMIRSERPDFPDEFDFPEQEIKKPGIKDINIKIIPTWKWLLNSQINQLLVGR